jgi:hypothetical protein
MSIRPSLSELIYVKLLVDLKKIQKISPVTFLYSHVIL